MENLIYNKLRVKALIRATWETALGMAIIETILYYVNR
jgi:hypothetical protein